LFLILSLLSSVMSVALSNSEEINPSFGKVVKDSKPKKTKSEPKPKNEDKPKHESKSKEEDKTKEETKSKNDEVKSNDQSTSKENDDTKGDDAASTSIDNPSALSTSDTSIKPSTSASDSSSTSSTDPNNPTTLTTLSSATNALQPPVTNPTQPPCDTTIATCPPVINSNENTRCPADFRIGSDGFCHVISCTLPKDQCPPPCDVKKGECPTGIKCKPNYHRGDDGFCHRVSCTLPKDQCPPPVCDLFTGICYWNEKCKTNSTESCEHSKGSSETDIVIKNYITNPIIQQQVAQQPSNVLIPMDTLQFCNLIGDQACVFMNSNFKILFNHTNQDNFGNWILNGEAQNIGANPINNVMVVWHLYDSLGNIVGLTQGFPIPSNLGTGQTTIFNLQLKSTDLTGIPKFYRISFIF